MEKGALCPFQMLFVFKILPFSKTKICRKQKLIVLPFTSLSQSACQKVGKKVFVKISRLAVGGGRGRRM
jgi:peroxiredoxin